MKYCPCGPSYFTPAFDAVVKAYEDGTIKKPAHFIIISDGIIYEAPKEDGAPPRPTIKETLVNFLRGIHHMLQLPRQVHDARMYGFHCSGTRGTATKTQLCSCGAAAGRARRILVSSR